MKRFLSILVCAFLLVSTFSALAYEVDESLVGEFTWWTYFDQAPFLKAEFEKMYPNVKVNLEVLGGSDYETKLLNTLPGGQGVPDMFDLEESYVYKFINSPLIANLDELGVREDLLRNYYEWAIVMGTDENGVLKGVCDNVSPVAYWYLRDACQQWLGTSDDAEISNMLKDWDTILEVAIDVKEKSDGKVFLLANIKDIADITGYSLTPFVRNGEFSIEDGWYELIDTMRAFWEAGVVADLGGWSSEWATAWNDGTLLFRVMPSWDYFTDWDKNTGNVGVAAPFLNSYSGGTYRAIYEHSDKKDICVKFIEFLALQEYQIENLKVNAQMPANKTVVEALGDDYSDSRYGGQNILKTYDKICEGIANILPDLYTRNVQKKFRNHASDGIKNGLSNDEIIENFKREIKDLYPELKGL